MRTVPKKEFENTLARPGFQIHASTESDRQEKSEAEASPSVVIGQLLFHSIPLYALIDYGATHSFITHGILERLGLKPIIVG